MPGRVILAVTDGNETRSEATLDEAIQSARDAGAAVYVVGIESDRFTPEPLTRLAEETGGAYYGAASSEALDGGLHLDRARAPAHLAPRVRDGGPAGRPDRAHRERRGGRAGPDGVQASRAPHPRARRPKPRRSSPRRSSRARGARSRSAGASSSSSSLATWFAFASAQGQLAEGTASRRTSRAESRRPSSERERNRLALAAGALPRDREDVRPPQPLEAAREHCSSGPTCPSGPSSSSTSCARSAMIAGLIAAAFGPPQLDDPGRARRRRASSRTGSSPSGRAGG